MKILHVAPIRPERDATGPSRSIRGLARAQAETGCRAAILSSLPAPDRILNERPSDILYLPRPRRRHFNPWHLSGDWVDKIREGMGTPDIVHFHSVYDPFQMAMGRLCRRLRWKYIVSPRGGMTLLAQQRKKTKKGIANLLSFRSFIERASAVHALSAPEAEEIRESFAVQEIVIVPNGIDEQLLDASGRLVPAHLGGFGKRGDLVLGFVGRIDLHHKGIDLLLDAMAAVRSWRPPVELSLFLVGPFQSRREERWFWSQVRSLDLVDTVRHLGPLFGDEKWRHLLACDVFVHTSRFEGMPMAVLEAMALGRPCLVTTGTNMGDVVREAGGWVCAPNPGSIAESLMNIKVRKGSLRDLGSMASRLIREKFTWKAVSMDLLMHYRRIVAS